MENFEQVERELLEQANRVATLNEYFEWLQQCDEYIEQLEERNCAKRSRLTGEIRQSLVARIARLAGEKTRLQRRFVHVGGNCAGSSNSDDNDNAGLEWREIDTAFESRVLTGAVINVRHIEPRQFLKDAKNIVFERVRNFIREHNSVKVNTAFNGEFVAGEKRANKSVNTKYYGLFQTSDLNEWYERHVIEPTLVSLEEFQERDSGWALSTILSLTINMDKYNPLHAGCNIQLPRDIMLKRAVINVKSTDNACFAWSVVAALHPAKKCAQRESSYPHYAAVLNLGDIEFPMTLKNIGKFERLNDISINVYGIEEKKILPLRLTEEKKNKHINLLYVQDNEGNIAHFAWIKNLSRLVGSQVNKHESKKYICDRCLHYFSSEEKLNAHDVNCKTLNNCIIRLPDEDDKLLRFQNYRNKEQLPFVVYADLECVLQKTEPDTNNTSYTYQHHQVFSIGYYVRCSYDTSLSMYRFRRGNDCVTWFAE
ncbi:uncharacterized protein LOC105835717, partial [Monomorium pharaonis]|uniref:uncharacterized protein LOC105835717 n=1 Tax=Monomorium pharaonis TaxID=307658 RepID=UPI0017461CA9